MKQGKTMMSFAADSSFSELVDRVMKETGAYQSRSEFMRDAVRQRVFELRGLGEEHKRWQKAMQKLKKKVKYYRPLTQEMKDELAWKYVEKGQ